VRMSSTAEIVKMLEERLRDELNYKMDSLRKELEAEISAVKSELKADIVDLSRELDKLYKIMITTLIGIMITLATTIITKIIP